MRLYFRGLAASPRFSVSQNWRYSTLAADRLFDEHAVVLALHLREGVAQRVQEVVVGRDDRPVEVELDHCLRLANGLDLTLEIRGFAASAR